MRSIPLLVLATLLAAATGAQQPPPPCEDAEFRHFDFWQGHWRVESAAGDTLGHNTITRVADGCALREEWVG